MKAYCLVSQQLREKIKKGYILGQPGIGTKKKKVGKGKNKRTIKIFSDDTLEDRIQPSSFEPRIGDEIFILDTEELGTFRPGKNEEVNEAISNLSKRQAQRVDINKGFVLQQGFTYAIPLLDRIKIKKNEWIKSSPKSSMGRIFLDVKMLSDYNPRMDEITYHNNVGRVIQPWLLVQPKAFNVRIYPELTLNQLRFFNGLGSTLTSPEIEEEFSENPLLYQRSTKYQRHPSLISSNPIITERGLELNLDLMGIGNHLIALKARQTPGVIDLTKYRENAEHKTNDFFEPLYNRGEGLLLEKGCHYLFSSLELLDIPPHLSAELVSYSDKGLEGTLDLAGFIDNGYNSSLVFEIIPTKSGRIGRRGETILPISDLIFYRTQIVGSKPLIPDKVYGEASGSAYQDKRGIEPAKYFQN